MHLDLTEEENAALTQELHEIVENDRYPFSPRIRTLRGILAKLKPEPVRKPLPEPKHYEPPRLNRGRRRRSFEMATKGSCLKSKTLSPNWKPLFVGWSNSDQSPEAR